MNANSALLLSELATKYVRWRGERWSAIPFELDAALAADMALAEAGRRARVKLAADLVRRFGFNERFLDAILFVPRERFVMPEDIGISAEDVPLLLDQGGHATVSAPHAYLLTYSLLGLKEGDHLLELGTGTGYGAALGRSIVGERGHVTSIEVDAALHGRAQRILKLLPKEESLRTTLLCGDGRAVGERLLSGQMESGGSLPTKVAITYALREFSVELEALLPEGGQLVAPVGATEDHQDLVRTEKREGRIVRQVHGAVRYVAER